MTDPRMQRLLAEVLFPIIGLVFWNWDFTFIAWFYALDLFSNNLFNQLRQKFNGIESFLPWLECIVLIMIIASTADFFTSFYSFLNYKDIGFAQGFLLIPLLLLGEWMRWKLEIKTGVIIRAHRKSHLIKIALFGLLLILSMNSIESTWLSWSFVGGLAVVNLWIKPVVLRK